MWLRYKKREKIQISTDRVKKETNHVGSFVKNSLVANKMAPSLSHWQKCGELFLRHSLWEHRKDLQEPKLMNVQSFPMPGFSWSSYFLTFAHVEPPASHQWHPYPLTQTLVPSWFLNMGVCFSKSQFCPTCGSSHVGSCHLPSLIQEEVLFFVLFSFLLVRVRWWLGHGGLKSKSHSRVSG